MTRPYLIRRARLTDVKAIWDIERLSFPEPWSLLSFLAELRNPVSTTLVAGPPPPQRWQTLGYLIYWQVVNEMHILNLAVHPRHRRRGLGRALLGAALDQARRNGAATAWLEVRPSNLPAQSLYASLGFHQVAVRPHYYQDNQEDALLLTFSWEEEEGR
ncbi:MAG: ribosomal-protein-alanine N-acetyltransferase [Deltaproteobacteria bacterium]|nr:ribosomal-protein-alanine N-acetyltransferase [Deltaproteobacteria bacterium]